MLNKLILIKELDDIKRFQIIVVKAQTIDLLKKYARV